MPRYQVKENCSYLGETWGGYFTFVTTDYQWAKKQMEFRFMEYVRRYKDNNPKISMGKTMCKLDMGSDGFMEIIIEDLEQTGGGSDGTTENICSNK